MPSPRRSLAQFYASVAAPKSELWLESQGQIDFYDDLRLIGPAAMRSPSTSGQRSPSQRAKEREVPSPRRRNGCHLIATGEVQRGNHDDGEDVVTGVRLHALGGLAITDGERMLAVGGARQRRLVAMLLIHRGTVVSRPLGGRGLRRGPDAGGGHHLAQLRGPFRKVVDGLAGAPTLVTSAPGYVLQVRDDTFDVAAFERLLADADRELGPRRRAQAAACAERALGLWAGRRTPSSPTRTGPAQRPNVWRSCTSSPTSASSKRSWHAAGAAEVIPTLEALVIEQPLREVFWRQL